MKSAKDDKIQWCLKQKCGIKIENPNSILCKAYFEKAEKALEMLVPALEQNNVDWIVTTAYYARYFAFYALLQKCGIKSEIHDCTLAVMKQIFIQESIVGDNYFMELSKAKELRNDLQYYVTEEMDLAELKGHAKLASEFVLKMEEIETKLSDDEITKIRIALQNHK